MLGCLAALACLSTCAGPSRAADWPQFLGPERNGISRETGLLDSWPAGGLKELWRVDGGVGMAGIAVSQGRAVTLVERDGKQQLVCLNADTGASIWQTPLAPAYGNQMGDGPRSTPTIAGDTVLAFTGEGTLAAVSLTDGRVRWSKNVVQELQGKPADYGMACSPLVVGDLVIVTVGAPQAAVAAYRVKSGERAWSAGDDPAGYSSPALLEVGGRSQVVVFTGASVLGITPQAGEVLWRYPYVTDYDCNIATPLASEGQVFVSAGENHGSVLLRLKPQGDRFDVEEVWKSEGARSVLRNEWQTSVLLDDHLFGFDNVGSAGPVTHLTCVRAATGERVWQQARFGKGNLIAADGKLLMTTIKGEVVVARASNKGYEEIGRQQVLEQTRQAPSLAEGRLYVRDDRHIVCLDVRQR
jgi:outer membrane protein assembly factor BamB